MSSVVADLPTQVPPLTPGTSLKMTQALAASFGSFDKDRELLTIPKGESPAPSEISD